MTPLQIALIEKLGADNGFEYGIRSESCTPAGPVPPIIPSSPNHRTSTDHGTLHPHRRYPPLMARPAATGEPERPGGCSHLVGGATELALFDHAGSRLFRYPTS